MARFLTREERREYKAKLKAAKEAKEAAIDAADRAAAERLAHVSLESGPKEYPRFTAVCVDGKCATCHGAQFRPTRRGADPSLAAAYGGIAAAATTALDAMYNGDLVTCITCGAIYEVG